MPQTETEIEEIARDIRYRIDLIWPVILQDVQAKRGLRDHPHQPARQASSG